ncbi:MAG: energy-coupling factor transporter transmembrane protein EcfT [Thermanaerothrix sp.]|nr:energy-coupling factor transporter transmembrane protein EcfT [Thermanaerothrix sp.]
MHRFTQPFPVRLAQIDARFKVLLGLGFLLGIALTPNGHWRALGGYAVVLFILWRWGAPQLPLWKTAMWVSPFLLAILPWLVLTPGPAWLVLGNERMSLTLTLPGLERVANLILRVVLSTTAVALLVGTTPWTALLAALRALGLPRILVSSMGLMLHYLGLWVSTAQTLHRARTARSPHLPGYRAGGRLTWRARTTGGMVGNLFLRALAQGERTYEAMLARGFDGEMRTLPVPPLQRRIWAGGLALAILLSLAGLIIP